MSLCRLAGPVLAVVLALGCVGQVAPSNAADAPARHYTGHYEWNEGGRGRLEATFFADGEGGWDVTFRFDHARRFQTWRGTALGELGSGAIEGFARGGRYRFAGAFEHGVFRGRHFEVRRTGLSESGTLTFEAPRARKESR